MIAKAHKKILQVVEMFYIFLNPHWGILLLEREEGRKGGRGDRGRKRDRDRDSERATLTGCLPYTPGPRIKPTTQACALTRDPT